MAAINSPTPAKKINAGKIMEKKELWYTVSGRKYFLGLLRKTGWWLCIRKECRCGRQESKPRMWLGESGQVPLPGLVRGLDWVGSGTSSGSSISAEGNIQVQGISQPSASRGKGVLPMNMVTGGR
jgi:hypothetical protein